MEEIAPGYILQRTYLRSRIQRWKKKKRLSFIEVGAGNGVNSQLLLSYGLSGIAFDLNSEACEKNRERNKKYIEQGKFKVLNQNFLTYESTIKADIIFSSMVIEHLDEVGVNKYFEKSKNCLSEGGVIACIVPANMKFWGIEDEIAGHYKRYSMKCFEDLAITHSLDIVGQAGLTYPVSNILLSLSNKLVSRAEGKKLELNNEEKTKLSGNRNVRFKTHFPAYMKILLNEFTLYPFHLIQRLFKRNTNAMVIYCELQYGK
jgi:cyclopropane fatty-acyl-phospholipid synthase-like methyltransferase